MALSWKASKILMLARSTVEIAMAFTPIILIYISKEIIDLLAGSAGNAQENADLSTNKFFILIIFFILVRLITSGLSKVKEICGGIHKDLISKHVQVAMACKSVSLDLSFFDSVTFYNEMNNARRDSHSLEVYTWLIIDMIRSGVQFIASAVILARLSPVLTVLLILASIPSIFIEKKFTKLNYYWQRGKASEERKMSYLLNILMGREFAKDIRLFGISQIMLTKYLNIWDTWFNEKTAIIVKKGVWAGILAVLPLLLEAGMMLYIGVQIIRGVLTVGDYSLYSGMLAQVIGGLLSIISLGSQIYDNHLRIFSFEKFMATENKMKGQGHKELDKILKIDFVDVTFKYPDTEIYILKNVCFSISANEKIALVGLNGAGKSTIIKLILRFYDPTDGTILVNGTDIHEYDLHQFRKKFSVLFQDYTNYAFTARDNITLSNIDEEDNEPGIKDACNRSEAQGIIDKFASGLDTYLTRQFDEDGKELSGGEWQRIALARAFFRNGDIIILDEPSASLDPEAEYKIFRKFAELCEGKGAIFISHRLSNVTMADRILVLDKGEIIEDGSHSELLSKNGKYAYLFRLQAEKYKVGSSNANAVENSIAK
jgi:ABC-type multidrug transport system, ATPase and permease components